MTGAGLSVVTGHAGRLSRRAGLPAFGLVVDRRTRGARTGLAFGAARGNPAPTREPTGCLLDGLPPGRRPRQGRFASLRDGLRPPLTRPSSRRPATTRVARGGRGPEPDQQAGGVERGERGRTPTPPAPTDHHPRKEAQLTDRTATATDLPAAP
jgi:hypothetical protein